jgi:putative ABC transport system substrate-binding protein
MARVAVLRDSFTTVGIGQLAAIQGAAGLQEAGWAVGRNAQIDIRWGMGDAERIRKNVTELVALTPDVIFATTFPIVVALQQATRAVPIVFAGLIDPVGGATALPLGACMNRHDHLSRLTCDWLMMRRCRRASKAV